MANHDKRGRGRPKTVWTPDTDLLLTMYHVGKVAQMLDLSYTTVNKRLKELGLDPVSCKAALNDEQRALLGTKPDQELADEWGVPVSLVVVERKRAVGMLKRGREKNTNWQGPEWMTDQKRARLGKERDAELARQWGISRQRVEQIRSKLGIPLNVIEKEPDWESVKDRLGKESDKDLAAEIGVSVADMARYRIDTIGKKNPRIDMTEEQWDMLGKIPDIVLAERWGRALAWVRNRRVAMGIGPVDPSTYLHKPRTKRGEGRKHHRFSRRNNEQVGTTQCEQGGSEEDGSGSGQ